MPFLGWSSRVLTGCLACVASRSFRPDQAPDAWNFEDFMHGPSKHPTPAPPSRAPTAEPTIPHVSNDNPFKQKMQKLLWAERHGDAKERASAKARLSLLQKEAKLILAGKAPPEANNLNLLVNTVVGLTDSPTAFPTTAPTKFRGLITPSGVRIAATGYPTAMPTLKPTPEKLRQIYQYLRPDSKGSSDGSVDPDEFVGLDTNQVHQEELQNWLMKLSPSMLEDMEEAAGIDAEVTTDRMSSVLASVGNDVWSCETVDERGYLGRFSPRSRVSPTV